MDAPGPMDERHLPRGLSPDRALRWCVARTLRDVRLSAARQRKLSLPNALRLFERRFAAITIRSAVEVDLSLTGKERQWFARRYRQSRAR